MPSVFNHENSCWGVKRPFCNVFQYDFHEIQNRKIPELGNSPSSGFPSAGINSIQYSVSSNGYYGYQPHSIASDQVTDKSDSTSCDCSEDNAMEVEDNSNRPPSANFGNQFMINCNILKSSHFKRKRHIADSVEDATKRMRQNELADADPGLPTHVNHRKEYYSYPKCLISHFM